MKEPVTIGDIPIIGKVFEPGDIVDFGKEVLSVWEQKGDAVLVYNHRGMVRIMPALLLEPHVGPLE